MNPLKTIALMLLLGVAANVQALSVESIEYASLRNDLGALLAMRDEANTQTSDYASAYLDFRIGVAANVMGDTKLAKSSLKSSAKTLQRKLKESPDSVPHMALLANVYGMTIGVSPIKGAFLGPKSQKLIDRAMALAPNDPTVLLVKGISLYNMPSMFGGSKSEALEMLEQAIAAFDASLATPAWGPREAQVWRALTLDALDKRDAAIVELNSALEREPDYAWARFVLGNLESAS